MNNKAALEQEVNVFDKTQWGVHVLGPDNIFAAKSFQEATEKAAEFNRMVVNLIYPISDSEYHAIIFARVAVWGELSKFEHDPEETDWTEMV